MAGPISLPSPMIVTGGLQAPGGFACAVGVPELQVRTLALGQPAPTSFALTGFGSDVGITSTFNPFINQVLPLLRQHRIPVAACGVVRQECGTGAFATQCERYLDVFFLRPLF